VGKRKHKVKVDLEPLRHELLDIADEFETRIDGAISRAMTVEALLKRIEELERDE
jgi:hypothetical protein